MRKNTLKMYISSSPIMDVNAFEQFQNVSVSFWLKCTKTNWKNYFRILIHLMETSPKLFLKEIKTSNLNTKPYHPEGISIGSDNCDFLKVSDSMEVYEMSKFFP